MSIPLLLPLPHLLGKYLPHIVVLLLVRAGRRVRRSLLVRQYLGSALAAIQRRLGQLPRLGHVLDYAPVRSPSATATAATRRQI